MKKKMMNLDELVMRELMLRIERGEFSPGERLPTERRLAEMASVQRMTARAALRRLADRGYASVRQRDGYFVAPRRVRVRLSRGTDFLRDFLNEDVEWTDARAEWTVVTENLANATFLPLGGHAVEIARTGRRLGEPVALEQWFFPAASRREGEIPMNPQIFWGTAPKAAAHGTAKDPCRAFSSFPGIALESDQSQTAKPVWASCRMDVAFARERAAALLCVEPPAPVYLARIHGYAGDGSVACFRKILIRADRFEFENHTEGE